MPQQPKANPLSTTPPGVGYPVPPPADPNKPKGQMPQVTMPSEYPRQLMQSSPVLRGISRGVGEMATGMLSPQGLATAAALMAPEVGFPVWVIQSLLKLKMGYDGIKGLADSLPQARNAFARGDTEEGVAQIVHSLGYLGMAAAPAGIKMHPELQAAWRGDIPTEQPTMADAMLLGAGGTIPALTSIEGPAGRAYFEGPDNLARWETPGYQSPPVLTVSTPPKGSLEIPRALDSLIKQGIDPRTIVYRDTSQLSVAEREGAAVPRDLTYDQFRQLHPEVANSKELQILEKRAPVATPPPDLSTATAELPSSVTEAQPAAPVQKGGSEKSPLAHTPSGAISYGSRRRRTTPTPQQLVSAERGKAKAAEMAAQVGTAPRVAAEPVPAGLPEETKFPMTAAPTTPQTQQPITGGILEQAISALMESNRIMAQHIQMLTAKVMGGQPVTAADVAPAAEAAKTAAEVPATKTPVAAPAKPVASTPQEFTPERITSLPPDSVFVFGSNTEGRHGAGAAKLARDRFGAVYGQGRGLQGQSYGIVTKDLSKGNRSVPLSEIGNQVDELLNFAAQHPEKKFVVTKIGTGLGGFSTGEIAGLFKGKSIPSNVVLPKEFAEVAPTPQAPVSDTDISSLVQDALKATEKERAESAKPGKKGPAPGTIQGPRERVREEPKQPVMRTFKTQMPDGTFVEKTVDISKVKAAASPQYRPGDVTTVPKESFEPKNRAELDAALARGEKQINVRIGKGEFTVLEPQKDVRGNVVPNRYVVMPRQGGEATSIDASRVTSFTGGGEPARATTTMTAPGRLKAKDNEVILPSGHSARTVQREGESIHTREEFADSLAELKRRADAGDGASAYQLREINEALDAPEGYVFPKTGAVKTTPAGTVKRIKVVIPESSATGVAREPARPARNILGQEEQAAAGIVREPGGGGVTRGLQEQQSAEMNAEVARMVDQVQAGTLDLSKVASPYRKALADALMSRNLIDFSKVKSRLPSQQAQKGYVLQEYLEGQLERAVKTLPPSATQPAKGLKPQTAESQARTQQRMEEAGAGKGVPFTHREGVAGPVAVKQLPTKEELAAPPKPEQLFKGQRKMELQSAGKVQGAEAVKPIPPPSAETATADAFRQRSLDMQKLKTKQERYSKMSPSAPIAQKLLKEINELKQKLAPAIPKPPAQ